MATGHIRGVSPVDGVGTVPRSDSPDVGAGSLTGLPSSVPKVVGRGGGYDWTRHTRTYSVRLAGPGSTVGSPYTPFSAPAATSTGPGIGFPLL